jgi:3-hydroxybutyryl-CoA dehydratase
MNRAFNEGDTFAHQRTCERYAPVYYAAASGDFNPIHLDPAVAEKAGLGGVILHGMCTMAWAVEAAVRFVGDPGALTKFRVRFSRPVAPGDTVTFQGRVTRVDGARLEGELSAKNQRGEDVLKGASFEANIGREG